MPAPLLAFLLDCLLTIQPLNHKQTLPGKGHYTDPDYLDAEFLFYDEDAHLVNVTVAQALDFEM